MENQNASICYSIVRAWQRELVHLPTQDVMSNKKKMLLCVQAIKQLMPECVRTPATIGDSHLKLKLV